MTRNRHHPREPEDTDELLEERERPSEEDGRRVDEMLEKTQPKAPEYKFKFDLKPREVKAHLDKFVIGQDGPKKALSNAVCYHYARVRRAIAGEDNTGMAGMKKNVMLFGSTGVGKTYMVNKLAELIGVPWTRQDATRLSSTGYVGKNVDDMIRDLYISSGKNLDAAQFGIVMLDEIDKIRYTEGYGKDVNGLEVQHRLLKVMEETNVDLVSSEDPLISRQAIIMREHDRQTRQRPTLNTRHVLFITSGNFPGLEDIVVNRLGSYDVAEGDWRNHVTAQDLVKYGFESEFVGRAPIHVGFHELNADHLYRILTESSDSIINQYIQDLGSYGIKLTFEDNALRTIATRAATYKTGARALVTVLEKTMQDFLFDLPSTDIKEFTVTQDIVEDPKGAHEIMMGKYEQQRKYSEFMGFTEQYKTAHDIRLTFTKDAYESILKRSQASGQPIAGLLETMLGKFPFALGLFDKKELEVNAELVTDPVKYVKNLTKKYMEQSGA